MENTIKYKTKYPAFELHTHRPNTQPNQVKLDRRPEPCITPSLEMFRRENWLHALLSSTNVALTSPSSLDQVLSAQTKSDETDLRILEAEDVRSWFLQHIHASLLNTFSREEVSTFAGFLSEEEETLMCHLAASICNQHLTSSEIVQTTGANPRMEAYAPLLPFLKRTEELLSVGGDDRLSIDFLNAKVNKYLSSTVPRPNLISRASCTCSSITLENYLLANSVRRSFLLAVFEKLNNMKVPTAAETKVAIRATFRAVQEQLLERLQHILGLTGMAAETVLFPSGSDAEYLPLIAGLIRSHTLSGDASKVKVYNYVCAAGEVGSGTANAAGGKHFSTLLPRGDLLPAADAHLTGIDPHWVTVVQFPPRNRHGAVELSEAQIVERVRRDLAADPNAVAVMHAVCGSKTGLVHPSLDTIADLVAEFRDRLIVVVDACQLRCDLRHIQRYAALGYIVLVTASKFFTAPPFAGAVVLPPRVVLEIESHLTMAVSPEGGNVCVFPPGLRQYITGFEVPPAMPRLRDFLCVDNDWVNLGLHLRWSCGVNMMERYQALPRGAVEAFTAKWVARVKALVAQQAPYLRVLVEGGDENGYEADSTDFTAGVSGIVSIVVSVVDTEAVEEARAASTALTGFKHLLRASATPPKPSSASAIPLRALSFEECKAFHAQLTLETPVSLATEQGHRCMIGQPVKLADSGFAVVRIALGADVVVSALEGADSAAQLEKVLADDDIVVAKMVHLARSWHRSVAATAVSGTGSASVLDTGITMSALDQQLLLSTDDTAVDTAAAATAAVATAATVLQVLKQAYPATSPIPDVCLLYDLDAIDATNAALQTAFATHLPAGLLYLHCFAVKSAPLTYLLHHAVQRGLGLETASITEVKQALRCGCAPARIVYDSPCKTAAELKFVLEMGITVNANSLQEVVKIATVVDALKRECSPSASVIGLRVNPMVGAGQIDALSTATASSKFGVPCKYADQADEKVPPVERLDLRAEIIATFVKYPFLRGIMCHVGSQGMPLEAMVQGAACIITLANDIDRACREAGEKGPRITHIDIGGGLSANYDSDTVTPTFAEYAAMLAERCGAELSAVPNRTLVTEFGKALVAKCGVIATRVEEGREFSALSTTEAVSAGNQMVLATVHAGADLLLRTAYCPDKFSHRLMLLDAHKQVLTTSEASTDGVSAGQDLWSLSPTSVREAAKVTIAGPLCFSGDILGKNLNLPHPRVGDICLVLDAGANTLSTFSRHCSRRSPAVLAYRRVTLQVPALGTLRTSVTAAAGAGEESSMYDSYVVTCIRPAETEAEVMRFWG